MTDKLLYDINDVLTFQLADGHYYATVILDIRQYGGNCTYDFGKITYKGTSMPGIEDITGAGLLGRRVPAGRGMNMTEILTMNFEDIMKQGGIDVIMKREAEKNNSYVLGMCMAGVEHRDLVTFKNKFTKIGNLPLQEICKNSASSSGETTFKGFARGYTDLDTFMGTFKMVAFKIADLLVS